MSADNFRSDAVFAKGSRPSAGARRRS